MALANPSDTLVLGIRACSRGEWREGLTHLSRLEHWASDSRQLPGIFYSYLGHAVARCEGRKRDGIAMCRHAVDREPFQPVHYLNLARSYLLVRDRRRAVKTLLRGLAIDATHRDLLELRDQLGVRHRRAILCLTRTSFVNKLLGRLRAKLRR